MKIAFQMDPIMGVNINAIHTATFALGSPVAVQSGSANFFRGLSCNRPIGLLSICLFIARHPSIPAGLS